MLDLSSAAGGDRRRGPFGRGVAITSASTSPLSRPILRSPPHQRGPDRLGAHTASAPGVMAHLGVTVRVHISTRRDFMRFMHDADPSSAGLRIDREEFVLPCRLKSSRSINVHSGGLADGEVCPNCGRSCYASHGMSMRVSARRQVRVTHHRRAAQTGQDGSAAGDLDVPSTGMPERRSALHHIRTDARGGVCRISRHRRSAGDVRQATHGPRPSRSEGECR
jgi:hypothetical protein